MTKLIPIKLKKKRRLGERETVGEDAQNLITRDGPMEELIDLNM